MKRLLCFLFRHPVELTGVRLGSIHQARCVRCGRLYAMHADHDGMLLDWFPTFELLLREGRP